MTVRMINHVWADAYRIAPQDEEPEWMSGKASGTVLLVGEDNPQDDRPQYALWPVPAKGHPSCAGKVLQSKILRVPHAVYYGLWRTNLCLSGAWSTEEARARARALVQNPVPWRVIVMLGRKVAGAFEAELGLAVRLFGYELHWNEREDTWITIASLPHPSGRSRTWNDARSYDRALVLLHDVSPSHPWGSLGKIPVEEQVVKHGNSESLDGVPLLPPGADGQDTA